MRWWDWIILFGLAITIEQLFAMHRRMVVLTNLLNNAHTQLDRIEERLPEHREFFDL